MITFPEALIAETAIWDARTAAEAGRSLAKDPSQLDPFDALNLEAGERFLKQPRALKGDLSVLIPELGRLGVIDFSEGHSVEEQATRYVSALERIRTGSENSEDQTIRTEMKALFYCLTLVNQCKVKSSLSWYP